MNEDEAAARLVAARARLREAESAMSPSSPASTTYSSASTASSARPPYQWGSGNEGIDKLVAAHMLSRPVPASYYGTGDTSYIAGESTRPVPDLTHSYDETKPFVTTEQGTTGQRVSMNTNDWKPGIPSITAIAADPRGTFPGIDSEKSFKVSEGANQYIQGRVVQTFSQAAHGNLDEVARKAAADPSVENVYARDTAASAAHDVQWGGGTVQHQLGLNAWDKTPVNPDVRDAMRARAAFSGAEKHARRESTSSSGSNPVDTKRPKIAETGQKRGSANSR
jgi:hypothetical protein